MSIQMIHVVWNEQQAEKSWQQGRNDYTPYMFEILNYLGIVFSKWTPNSWMEHQPGGITIVVGLDDRSEWPSIFKQYCENGNSVLTIGSSFGLHDVLGLNKPEGKKIQEGWIQWNDCKLAESLRSSFHFFGASLVEPCPDTEALGSLIRRNGEVSLFPAFTMRPYASSYAAMICFDIAKSFCMIQQGISVEKDGLPASDGTASVDDDILKTDDGSVLDWLHDRDKADPMSAAFFMYPIVDEMRIFFIRTLHLLHEKMGEAMVHSWFWPEGIDGIGHISHDSDGNSIDAAELMLEKLLEADIHSTWCVIMPGYPQSVYEKMIEAGHEIALHYNALSTEENSLWDEEHFNLQLDRLNQQLKNRVSIKTNKNHYLRWEGDIQFYQWCERAGIAVEQSKGGTKQGNKGFLAGTCHPYIPVSNALERNRLMQVFSLPTLAWDPPTALRCTLKEAQSIIELSAHVNGVVHFLFHPAALVNEEVGPALVDLVNYGRMQGLHWWTSKQLFRWLQIKRGIDVSVQPGTNEGKQLYISAQHPCKGLTVLITQLPSKMGIPSNNGTIRSIRFKQRFGLSFHEIILDVRQGNTIIPFD
ncbi:hypothetical protein [Paenibacillus sp. Soil724D2]|uniref:hypothetical protein n=1 Tax=Paenibacillus sp. (strain Soil724D2) TaxID=1736392 RepID=UPI000713A8A5|nr:hypothetical protein [Paenibacillus sp. Soil724D2]KRE36491.1 hypothetical protein ASG85_10010 [Paenibacillus sp. Soil724D2]